MVPDEDAVCLTDAPLPMVTARVPPVYVQVIHCQCAQIFLSLFHSEQKPAGNGKSLYMLIVISTEQV